MNTIQALLESLPSSPTPEETMVMALAFCARSAMVSDRAEAIHAVYTVVSGNPNHRQDITELRDILSAALEAAHA